MSDIFIPSTVKYTQPAEIAQRRVLLVSLPGEGKTYTSITTSPNPIVADIDRSITDPRLVALKVPTIPLWDDEYCDKILKKKIKSNAFKEFLKGDGMKLALEQTLIVDSCSSLQDAMQEYLWNIAPKGENGQPDGRAFWGLVKDEYIEIFTLMTKLRCHLILTAHLAENRKKENGLLLGYGPLMDGSIKAQFSRFFTDVIRHWAVEKKSGDTVTTEYKWQVKSDDMFKAKCRANVNTMFIPADFNNLLKIN